MGITEESNYEVVIDSPGRINIIGEHIDYNNGFVLPTAIDKKIRFAFRKNGSSNLCKVLSKDFNKSFVIHLEKISRS